MSNNNHHDAIESTTNRSPAQRQALWNMWQNYLNDVQTELDKTGDNFNPESPSVKKAMALAYHILGQQNRENSMRLTDFIREHDLVDLTKAHKPNWKQITPLVLQILGAAVGGALGMTPYFAGYTGSKAQSFQGASSMVNGIFVQGGQGVGSLMHSVQQGEQAKFSNNLEATKRSQGDSDHQRNKDMESQRRMEEENRRTEENKHQAIRQITSSQA